MTTTEYRDAATGRRATLEPPAAGDGAGLHTATFSVGERDPWGFRWRVVGTLRGTRELCDALVRAWMRQEAA